eukprot:COSAG04_NODE_2583_length_3896_cov_90.326574_2_plen_556_part_00
MAEIGRARRPRLASLPRGIAHTAPALSPRACRAEALGRQANSRAAMSSKKAAKAAKRAKRSSKLSKLVGAAEVGDVEMMKRVMSGAKLDLDTLVAVEGWFINGTQKYKDARATALCAAVVHEKEAAVRLLLDRAANPSVADSTGWTPLMVAAYEGRTPILRLLLAARADVDAVHPATGDTAFHCACFSNQPDCAEALVRAGCDTTARSKGDETGQEIAEDEGNAAVLARLSAVAAEVRGQRQAAAKAAAEAAALAAATEQLEDVAGVAVEGLPHPELNDVYLPAGEHEGWPRFESGQGRHLYCITALRVWALRASFDPNARDAKAYVRVEDGLLPTAEHRWRCGREDHATTMTLLRSAEEVAEHTERLQLVHEQLQAELDAEKAAAEAAALAAATEQLQGVAGVAVEGLPHPELNDVYLPAGELEGWPRFESGQGKHLYRGIADCGWYFREVFDASAKNPKAWIRARDGMLPIGYQTWRCFDSRWKDQVATVALLSVEELAEQTERLRLARERRQAELEKEKQAVTLAAAAEQLQGVAGVVVEGLPEASGQASSC